MEDFANSPGVTTRLRQWQSVKTIRYSVLQVTVLLVFHENFMGSFLLWFAIRTRSRLLVQSNPQDIHTRHIILQQILYCSHFTKCPMSFSPHSQGQTLVSGKQYEPVLKCNVSSIMECLKLSFQSFTIYLMNT